MNKEEKIKIVGDLTNCLTDNKNIYLTDISGLDAEQTSNLRRMCFDKGVVLSVVKNTLLKKAMDACDKDFSSFDDLLKGNTALMISNASNAPAKVIKSFLEKTKLEKPTLKGGHVEESIYLGHDQLDILVALKSKEELLADLIALLKSPMTNLISSLSSANQNISGILRSLETTPVLKKGSVAEESTAEEPTAEESTAEESTAEEPTAEEPTAEEPTAEDSTAEEPKSEEESDANKKNVE